MAVRQYLLEHRYIGEKYRLLLDTPDRETADQAVKWSTFEQLTAEQRTHPFNYLLLEATYQIPTLRESPGISASIVAARGGFVP
jgi:hypothetical protein